MDPIHEQIDRMTRRHFFGRTTGMSLGNGRSRQLACRRKPGGRSSQRGNDRHGRHRLEKPVACPDCRTSRPRRGEPSICI